MTGAFSNLNEGICDNLSNMENIEHEWEWDTSIDGLVDGHFVSRKILAVLFDPFNFFIAHLGIFIRNAICSKHFNFFFFLYLLKKQLSQKIGSKDDILVILYWMLMSFKKNYEICFK